MTSTSVHQPGTSCVDKTGYKKGHITFLLIRCEANAHHVVCEVHVFYLDTLKPPSYWQCGFWHLTKTSGIVCTTNYFVLQIQLQATDIQKEFENTHLVGSYADWARHVGAFAQGYTTDL